MTFNELYKILVIYHKIVTHQYFLDEMQIPDLIIVTKYLDYAECASWVQTRQIMLSVLKPYLKNKNLTADQLFPLPIDKKEQEKDTSVDPNMIKWFNTVQENYNKKDSD